jgi:hypothetical protein
MEKAFQEAMKKASEKQYLLSFNKSECLYEEQEQLQKPEAPAAGIIVSVVFSGEGKKYLNLKDKNSIVEEADIFRQGIFNCRTSRKTRLETTK